MLNLNLNIQNALLKRDVKGTVSYQIRPDAFSGSIVVAIPGALFKNGLNQNQFGMSHPYDDISSYIKGQGQQLGNNVNIIVSSSLSASSSLWATSSIIKWDNPQDQYPSSLYMNGANSLVVNQLFAAKEGVNLSFDKSFVIETWVGWNETASISGSGGWKPERIFAWNYDPADVSGSVLVWDGSWAGSTGGGNISGSSKFSFDYYDGAEYREDALYGTGSFNIIANYAWNHYAISYTSSSRQMNLYINGYNQNSLNIAANKILNQDPSEYFQIMGAVDNSFAQGAYSGSQIVMQDYRIYNGTNKNYTGPSIATPQSIVTFGNPSVWP